MSGSSSTPRSTISPSVDNAARVRMGLEEHAAPDWMRITSTKAGAARGRSYNEEAAEE